MWNVKANCALYAEVARSIWRSVANDSCSLNIEDLHKYVLSSLPTNVSRLTRQQTAIWYLVTCDKVDGDQRGREQMAALDFRFNLSSMSFLGY